MSDGQVIFEITADGKHAIASVKDVTKAIESESRKWDKSAKEGTDAIDNSFSKMIGKIVGGLAAAGVANILKSWGTAAIEAASDLQEVQNVVDVTFGESASVIEAWSKKAGEQFGLTETQAKKFTSTLGAMMKSAGMSGNEIVEMSTDLAGLAADMASFYNLDFDTAFAKIRSGISGETEPLKQLGVNMSVANLEAFALSKGLNKAFNEMSQGEQVMLRYQYLMQATSDAQGDFARTSDGYANASRRVETAMNSLKTKGGELLLNVIGPLTDKFATFLENLTKEPQRTVLDDLNDIELNTGKQLAEIENTYGKASDLIKVLDDISKQVVTLSDGSVLNYESLFSELGDIEKSGGDIKQYIQSLGLDVDSVVTKYDEWKLATKQLTQLVPDLSSVIDEETGSIDGGTAALQKNLDEWKSYQEQKIEWAAYYAAEEALAVQKGEQAALQLTADARQRQLERAKAAVEEIAKTPGLLQHELSWYGDPTPERLQEFTRFRNQPNVRTEEQQAYNNALDEYTKAQNLANEAAAAAAKNADANIEAEQLLADKKQVLIDKYGEQEKVIEEVSEAVEGYLGKSNDEWKETTAAVNESVQALADYVQSVHDATEASVNSTLSGFKRVQTAQQQQEEATNKLKEFEKELRDSGKYTEKEIRIKVNDANAQITLNNLNESLKSQLAFINEYQANLEKARELGVSEEVLASLSDGSNESARQLYAIVEAYKNWDGSEMPEDIKELNDLFKEVSDGKASFTDALTQQKLAVDTTYDAMVDKALTAIEEMNLGDEAHDSMAETVQGLASGINDNVDGVAAAVDAIIAQLDRLNGLGFSFNLAGMEFGFHLDGSHEMGLDYVPFSGYLAELHEGEGILTAEENRIWQRFKAGQQSSANVDYEALGGVMRDNVHAGGNVYLDGRTVGQVISQMQGNQFRSLQRSGWQQ